MRNTRKLHFPHGSGSFVSSGASSIVGDLCGVRRSSADVFEAGSIVARSSLEVKICSSLDSARIQSSLDSIPRDKRYHRALQLFDEPG
jgi:hypothetical protein